MTRWESASAASTPGHIYSSMDWVIRFAFHSQTPPKESGFFIGRTGACDVLVEPHQRCSQSQRPFFSMSYNFESGALLLTAFQRVRVGGHL